MVDAGDSKSPDGNIVRVRVSPWAPPLFLNKNNTLRLFFDVSVLFHFNLHTYVFLSTRQSTRHFVLFTFTDYVNFNRVSILSTALIALIAFAFCLTALV